MLVLSGQHLYYFKDCGGLSGQHFKISFKKDVFWLVCQANTYIYFKDVVVVVKKSGQTL